VTTKYTDTKIKKLRAKRKILNKIAKASRKANR
jgi:hypothetical protein